MKLEQIIPLLLSTEQGYNLGKICAGIFGLLTLFVSLNMLSSWWSDARLVFSSPSNVAHLNLSSPVDELLQAIPEAHLFGYYPPSSSNGIPVTSSQLRITGIIEVHSEEGEEIASSKVIISMNSGIGKVYQVGDVLPDGIKVTAIMADGVILDNGGHVERLPLQRPNLEKA